METKVQEIDYSLVANISDYEKYVYMYNKKYEKITGCSIKNAYSQKKTKIIEGFLKITNKCGKRIYRRFRGCQVESDNVYLGYRSMCELGLKNDDEVLIEPTSWFRYYWSNSDIYIRFTVKIAAFGLLCTVASTVLSIIQLFL